MAPWTPRELSGPRHRAPSAVHCAPRPAAPLCASRARPGRRAGPGALARRQAALHRRVPGLRNALRLHMGADDIPREKPLLNGGTSTAGSRVERRASFNGSTSRRSRQNSDGRSQGKSAAGTAAAYAVRGAPGVCSQGHFSYIVSVPGSPRSQRRNAELQYKLGRDRLSNYRRRWLDPFSSEAELYVKWTRVVIVAAALSAFVTPARCETRAQDLVRHAVRGALGSVWAEPTFCRRTAQARV